MIIYVDIDMTICLLNPLDKTNYNLALPLTERINKINELYEDGHIIVYWTARGSGSGLNWRTITEEQLFKWGAKYHNLLFGKPVYDLFIDDKALNAINNFADIDSYIRSVS